MFAKAEPMATIPQSKAGGWSPWSLARRILDPALILGVVAVMAYGAFWPIFGTLPGRGAQLLTLVAIATTLVAGFVSPRGRRPAFHLLWVALGMAAALGTVGIFSVGFAYLIAAALLVLAIIASPNRSNVELRYDWRYVVGFHIGYLLMLAVMFTLIGLRS